MPEKELKKRSGTVISGAYGLGNPGDEAVLEAVLDQLSEADPSQAVTILSRTPSKTSERFKLRSLWSFDLPRIVKALRSTRLFISGGGSLIQDSTSRRSLLYYLFMIWLAKRCGCRVFMYGCGAGPITGSFGKKLTRKVLSSCADCISVRDSGALSTLKELGVEGPEMLLTGDPVLSLEIPEEKDELRTLSAFGMAPESRFSVYSLRYSKDLSENEAVLAEAAENCFTEQGLESVFMAFSPEDIAFAERICALMKSPSRIVSGSFGSSAMMSLLAKASVLVSMRLHPLIFACMEGTPCVGISCDPKISGFMAEAGSGLCMEMEELSAERLQSLTKEALGQGKDAVRKGLEPLKERQEGNLLKLRAFLEGGEEPRSEGPARIAFFTSDFGVGGMQKSLVNILKRLDLSRCSADVYYSGEDSFYELPEREGLRYIKCRPEPYWYRFVYFRLLKAFSKPFAPQERYDIAVDFNSYQNDCALMAVTCNAKRRVMFVHNDVRVKLAEEPRYRVLWHFFKGKFRYYDEFAAVSPRIVESFRECSGTRAPVWTIPNYIDTEEIFRMADQEHPLQVDTSKYNICAVGRLCHQKGIDLLLDIYAKAAEARPDIHLYLIGDGPDREALHNQARDLGIDLRVSFLGNMKNPYVIMDRMDALVLTSRYEGQGMVVLEAKALGLDLFVSRALEGCNPGIPCTDDICAAIMSADKHEKKRDDLKAYNENISRQLARVFRI